MKKTVTIRTDDDWLHKKPAGKKSLKDKIKGFVKEALKKKEK